MSPTAQAPGIRQDCAGTWSDPGPAPAAVPAGGPTGNPPGLPVGVAREPPAGLSIRPERPGDWPRIRRLHDEAFGEPGEGRLVDVELSDHVELVADYDGDRVSAGVRLPFHSFTVDLIYVSQRAADTLFSRETQNHNLGVTGRF